jgi:hypothetical protein
MTKAKSPGGKTPSAAPITLSPRQAEVPLVVHGVNQELLASCISAGRNCLKTVPGLAQCMIHYRVCNEAVVHPTAGVRVNPLTERATPGAAPLSESQAVSMAGGDGENVTGVGADMVPYSSIAEMDPAFVSPTATSTRLVWIVSVYLSRPMKNLNITPPRPFRSAGSSAGTQGVSSYTVIIDAQTGIETDFCLAGIVPAGTTDTDAQRTVP